MNRKKHVPVGPFEQGTSFCPIYIAWQVLDEARDYFRTNLIPSSASAKHKKHLIRPADTFSPSAAEKGNPMGEGQLADRLARRAEAVFAKHPFWQRKFGHRRSQTAATNRDAILIAMRHWLAGELARENPVLFNQLPESFKIGMPLPEAGKAGFSRPRPPRHAAGRRARSDAPYQHFVHGCALLDF